MSRTSWLSSTNTWSHPASRWGITSLYSHQIPMGAATERLTTAITTGRWAAPATKRTSCISASPWDAVAVNVRTPVASAETQALMALCSLSTAMKSASRSPSAMNSEMCSMIVVWGVMG